VSSQSRVRFFHWNEVPKERVSDMIDRRLITGSRIMLAHVHLQQGCLVPKHAHENEQVSYVLEGALRFWLGDDEAEEIEAPTGSIIVIPSNVPHRAQALTASLVLDIFSPPRQDWLEGTDDYLRRT
jgi:quercetin dioxygenase-like cupin family protein